jgi:hypothetical protein
MSVYTNQTNATPGDAFFAAAGSGGGGTPSNWSQYPAISTITYSGAGGIANFTEIYALTGLSTIYIDAQQINTTALDVSTVNGVPYDANPAPVFGTFSFTEGDSSATVSAIGITPESVVIVTPFGSDTSNPIVNISPGSNAYTITLSSPAPAGYYLNWVAFTGAK